MTVKVGDRTRCLSCMKPIVAGKNHEGIVWFHEGAQPRHEGIPEAYTAGDLEKCKLFLDTFAGNGRTSVKEWVENVRSYSSALGIPFSYFLTIMKLHREWDENIVRLMLNEGNSRMFETFEADYQTVFNQSVAFSKDKFIKNLPAPSIIENMVDYFWKVTEGLTEGQRKEIQKDTLKYFLEQKNHIQSCPFADKMFTVAYCNSYLSVTDALEKNYDSMVPLYLEFLVAISQGNSLMFN